MALYLVKKVYLTIIQFIREAEPLAGMSYMSYMSYIDPSNS